VRTLPRRLLRSGGVGSLGVDRPRPTFAGSIPATLTKFYQDMKLNSANRREMEKAARSLQNWLARNHPGQVLMVAATWVDEMPPMEVAPVAEGLDELSTESHTSRVRR